MGGPGAKMWTQIGGVVGTYTYQKLIMWSKCVGPLHWWWASVWVWHSGPGWAGG